MQDTDLPVVAVARSRGPARVLEAILDGVAGTLLFIMMMVTTVDVVGRYFFHSPLHGAYEGNELLLGVLVFTALPRVTWHGTHLTVSMVDGLLSARARCFKQGLLDWVSGGILAVLAWQLYLHASGMAEFGDRSNALDLPLAPLAWLIAALTALAALAALLRPFFFRLADAETQKGA
ncbi:TRAP transporter small permease [Pseudomonas sp. S 311-6]|uniref:TRAP transporter small permease n=1 Tax=Kerstersia gyiorum TaxID=206506 RepID=UPI0009FC2CDC|nr:TRAP transporter small permease [Kerstersia gyiorum]MCO7640331.1 TRAP transporter small permease [Pseudomonas sp. S 311-6]MCR4158929.1 TRAP transporter small permease [Kerstersia gyiorum]QBR40873.1 TRAP transporter small permease [Kerstersia gyiorum]